LIFFGVEEDGAGTGAATFGGRDVAGAAMEGTGGAVAIAATADPRALGGEALGFGEPHSMRLPLARPHSMRLPLARVIWRDNA
jgi:hypothetical protein